MKPIYDESLDTRWYREYSLRLHKKKLQDIKEKSLSSKPGRYKSVNPRKISYEPNKFSEVYRENMILFEKLNQISERKYSPSSIINPKSLNLTQRKKEAERIIQDNFEFVRRLTEKESFVPAKKLKKEYEKQEEYKRTISKASLNERLKKISFGDSKFFHLPPINQELLQGEKNRSDFLSKNDDAEKQQKIVVRKKIEPIKLKFHKKKGDLKVIKVSKEVIEGSGKKINSFAEEDSIFENSGVADKSYGCEDSAEKKNEDEGGYSSDHDNEDVGIETKYEDNVENLKIEGKNNEEKIEAVEDYNLDATNQENLEEENKINESEVDMVEKQEKSSENNEVLMDNQDEHDERRLDDNIPLEDDHSDENLSDSKIKEIENNLDPDT